MRVMLSGVVICGAMAKKCAISKNIYRIDHKTTLPSSPIQVVLLHKIYANSAMTALELMMGQLTVSELGVK